MHSQLPDEPQTYPPPHTSALASHLQAGALRFRALIHAGDVNAQRVFCSSSDHEAQGLPFVQHQVHLRRGRAGIYGALETCPILYGCREEALPLPQVWDNMVSNRWPSRLVLARGRWCLEDSVYLESENLADYELKMCSLYRV